MREGGIGAVPPEYSDSDSHISKPPEDPIGVGIARGVGKIAAGYFNSWLSTVSIDAGLRVTESDDLSSTFPSVTTISKGKPTKELTASASEGDDSNRRTDAEAGEAPGLQRVEAASEGVPEETQDDNHLSTEPVAPTMRTGLPSEAADDVTPSGTVSVERSIAANADLETPIHRAVSQPAEEAGEQDASIDGGTDAEAEAGPDALGQDEMTNSASDETGETTGRPIRTQEAARVLVTESNADTEEPTGDNDGEPAASSSGSGSPVEGQPSTPHEPSVKIAEPSASMSPIRTSQELPADLIEWLLQAKADHIYAEWQRALRGGGRIGDARPFASTTQLVEITPEPTTKVQQPERRAVPAANEPAELDLDRILSDIQKNLDKPDVQALLRTLYGRVKRIRLNEKADYPLVDRGSSAKPVLGKKSPPKEKLVAPDPPLADTHQTPTSASERPAVVPDRPTPPRSTGTSDHIPTASSSRVRMDQPASTSAPMQGIVVDSRPPKGRSTAPTSRPDVSCASHNIDMKPEFGAKMPDAKTGLGTTLVRVTVYQVVVAAVQGWLMVHWCVPSPIAKLVARKLAKILLGPGSRGERVLRTAISVMRLWDSVVAKLDEIGTRLAEDRPMRVDDTFCTPMPHTEGTEAAHPTRADGPTIICQDSGVAEPVVDDEVPSTAAGTHNKDAGADGVEPPDEHGPVMFARSDQCDVV